MSSTVWTWNTQEFTWDGVGFAWNSEPVTTFTASVSYSEGNDSVSVTALTAAPETFAATVTYTEGFDSLSIGAAAGVLRNITVEWKSPTKEIFKATIILPTKVDGPALNYFSGIPALDTLGLFKAPYIMPTQPKVSPAELGTKITAPVAIISVSKPKGV